MNILFRDIPEALKNTLLIADRCSFDLTQELTYSFPDHSVPPNHTTDSYLEELCTQAARRQYHVITPKIKERLNHELSLIKKHNLFSRKSVYGSPRISRRPSCRGYYSKIAGIEFRLRIRIGTVPLRSRINAVLHPE
mgnify:CR=1 FL=1